MSTASAQPSRRRHIIAASLLTGLSLVMLIYMFTTGARDGWVSFAATLGLVFVTAIEWSSKSGPTQRFLLGSDVLTVVYGLMLLGLLLKHA